MAVRIEPDGTVAQVVPANGRDFTLAELYRHLDCDTVDIRRLGDGRWLVVDDDGLRKALPLNPAATVLYNRGRFASIRIQYPVVGIVLIALSTEIE